MATAAAGERAAPGGGNSLGFLLVAGLFLSLGAAVALGPAGLDSACGAVLLLSVGPLAFTALLWLLSQCFPGFSAWLGLWGSLEMLSFYRPKKADSPAFGLQELLHSWGWLPDPKRWKPFPWNWLPDIVAWCWGLTEILFIAPIAAVCIAAVVPAMVALKAAWRHPRNERLREGIPELVRMVSRPLGRLMLKDPRNHSYIPWMLWLGTFTPCLFFWAMWRHKHFGLEASTLVIYHILRIGPRFQFFAHAHTIVHKAGHDHKGFFRKPFEVLNPVVEWWITPFYGVVPNNYSVAHMKIHHRWHNDVDDVHTNLDLDRTVLGSFLIYTPRFTLYWTGLSAIALLAKREEWALLKQLVSGMVVYYGTALLLFLWSPSFAVVYWVYPHMEACVLLCAISYLWHAFVEESDPGNQYVNSVTILEGHDNVWNEDYHVVHHHSPGCHWTDAPAHFEKHKEDYAKVQATIFRDTEEGMLLKMLFEKDFDGMARHFVDLNGKLTHEEKKAMIMRRLRVIVGETGRDGKRVQRDWAATETIRTFEGED